jgi:hypothetical protein
MKNMRDNGEVRLFPRSNDGKWGSWVGDYAGEDCSYQVVFAPGASLDLHMVPWILNFCVFFGNLLCYHYS